MFHLNTVLRSLESAVIISEGQASMLNVIRFLESELWTQLSWAIVIFESWKDVFFLFQAYPKFPSVRFL